MKQSLRLVLAFTLGVSVAGVALGQMAAAEKAPDKGLPMQELRAFADIFGRIKQDYVEPVDDRELLEFAIRGMLSGLDPHSSYLNEDEFQDLQVGTKGEFGGLGIEVGMEDGFVKVIAPIDDTPAKRAGVEAGDLIVKLDSKPIKGMSLDEAVSLMRGKPGTEIVLTIVREGAEKTIEITIVRDIIKVVSVKGRLLEGGFAYVRLSHFQARTTEDMLKLISKLKSETGNGLNGLILDLRNNPGGVLNGAVSVSDAFLSEGDIVYTKGRVDESKLDFTAAPDDVIEGAPMVVLVNGGSASASEIVAGALQDNQRAVIMGSRTFGKGSVQTIIPVTQSSAIKLTTARYFTPSGRSIQAEGIEPDIILSNLKVEQVNGGKDSSVKEADLARHLGNGSSDKDASQKKNGAGNGEGESDTPLAEKDYQLNEALNLLKGLHILQRKS
ncbi:MAG: S41 family peptidase [Candidatus Sedimenticola sp. 20ELBAFRAG]